MKHTWKYFIVLLLLTVYGTTNLLAKDYQLRLRLKKGAHFEYIFTSTDIVDQQMKKMPMQVEQRTSLTFTISVVGILKNGNYQLSMDYKRFATVMTLEGHTSSYDSDSTYRSNKLADLLSGMSKIHLNYEVSPTGVVSNLTGLEDLTQKISTDVRLSNLLKGIGTVEFIDQLLTYFPNGKVSQGASWIVPTILPEMKNLKYDLRYSLADAGADKIKLDFQSKFGYKQPNPSIREGREIQMEETIIQNGNVVLDPKTNMPVTSELKQVVDVTVNHTNEKTMDKSTTQMKINTVNSLKLLKSN